MATVFDGDNLLITLDAPTGGILTLDVQRLYSEWKEWQVAAFQNMGYPKAFETAAGFEIVPGTIAVPYFTVRNDLGWRIKPNESDHEIDIQGQLVRAEPTLPAFIPTTGGFTVAGIGLQPVAQQINSGVTLDPTELTNITNAIFNNVVEGGYTFEEIMRLIAAAAAGRIVQATDGSYTIYGIDGTTARILGELAANNGRTITSVDAA